MRELLLEIWTSVRRNKLRTALTGFSVAWGIFMLVILLGSGNGLKNGVLSNFANYATNSIEISGGWTSKAYKGLNKWRSIDLRNNDLEIIRSEFAEVDQVAAIAWFTSNTVSYGGNFMKATFLGALPMIEQIKRLEIVSGRFINQADITNYRKVVVIDQNLQKVLFGGSDPMGRMIKAGASNYTIIGVTKADADRTEATCHIPLSTGQLVYRANNPEMERAIITVNGLNTDEQMKDFERRLIRRLAAEHHYDPTDESAILIQNIMETFKSMALVFGGINAFVWIIGLGTLLAGVVGVSNIMLVTVTERTNEFGIRKALGAKPSSIIRLILAESILITSAFGYMGMVLGVAVMEVVSYMVGSNTGNTEMVGTLFLNPTLDLSVAVSATIVLVIAGLVAGYIPAYRAAQLKTIDALRHNK